MSHKADGVQRDLVAITVPGDNQIEPTPRPHHRVEGPEPGANLCATPVDAPGGNSDRIQNTVYHAPHERARGPTSR